MKHIGLYGGSFDPVHRGHLAMAQAALNECQLDEIVFIPCQDPVYKEVKQKTCLASAADRYAMLALACKSNTALSISRCEIDRITPSFTLITLDEFLAQRPQTRFYFLLGLDTFSTLPTWYQWQGILERVNLILLPRELSKEEQTRMNAEPLASLLSERKISDLERFKAHQNGGIWQIQPPLSPYSSTCVREQVHLKSSWQNLVTAEVADYIESKHLYQETE